MADDSDVTITVTRRALRSAYRWAQVNADDPGEADAGEFADAVVAQVPDLMDGPRRLDSLVRSRLVDAVDREKGWSAADCEMVMSVLKRTPNGPLEVRDDYAGEFDENEWTDAEKIDSALDYFGID